MTVPGNLSSPLLATAADGAAAAAGPIKSLRISAGDSAYLNRTPASMGNRRTMTIAFWYKNTFKSVSQLQQVFIAAQFTSPAKDYYTKFGRLDDGSLLFNSRQGGSDFFTLRTSQVLRDPNAWYHIVLAIDTTQATAANRVKLYINGSQITDFQTEAYPTQNKNMDYLNENQLHFIGRYLDNSYEYFDGYLADFYFIDGSQLDPTSFGAYDSNNVWQSAAYSGTFGTNGYHLLDFASESTVGHDSSGNDNDFTANNINSGATTYSGSVTDTASPSGSSMIIKAVGSSVTGTFNAGGGTGGNINYYSSSDGVSWSYEETGTGESSSFTAKFLSMGGGSNNSRQFTATSGSFEYSIAGSTSLDSNSSTVTVAQTQLFANSNLDILFDVPTNGTQSDTGAGGEVSGNYATFNPVLNPVNTLSNGNLNATAAGNNRVSLATFGIPASGKWYFEITDVDSSSGAFIFGVGAENVSITSYLGTSSSGWGYQTHASNAGYWNNNTFTTTGRINGHGSNTVVGVAVDRDAGKIWFAINGTFVNSGAPASGTNAQYTNLPSSGFLFPGASSAINKSFIFNAGQRAFAYSAPSGYKALCTTNLPTPAVSDGTDEFKTLLYSGNGATGSRSITGLSFTPDFSWFKGRSYSISHLLYDSVRGAGATKSLVSNGTNTEGSAGDNATYGYLESFDSSGFSIFGGSDVNNGYINKSSATYASWHWNAGANSNKTYTVKVVSDSGNKYRFDDFGTSAVTLQLAEGSTYIFDQSDSSNSGHPLRFSTTSDGTHNSGSEYTTGVTATGTPGSAGAKTTIVLPPVRSNSLTTNAGNNFDSSGAKTKAFDGDASTKAYTANNSDGTTQNTSYIQFNSTVAFSGNLKVKCDNGNAIYDVTTGSTLLATNNTGSDGQTINCGTISNVSKIRVLMAGGSRPAIYAIYIDDVILEDGAPGLYYYCSSHSGMGGQANTNSTAGSSNFDGSIQTTVKANQTAGFSIVTASPANNAVSMGHGLGKAPSVIFSKSTTVTYDWNVFSATLGGDEIMRLNTTAAKQTVSGYWNNVGTSTFSVASGNNANNSGTMLYMCFAEIEGFSKFGTYEGNSNADGPVIITGFQPALVIVKNVDTTANNPWFMMDQERGDFNGGYSNYLMSNEAYAENYYGGSLGQGTIIDILSNGFKLRGNGTTNNKSGDTHLYFAWAKNPFQANGGLAI